MKLLFKCGTKVLVTGAVVGVVGIGLYRILRSICSNRDGATGEDLKIDIQSLVDGSFSQESLAMELEDDRKTNTVIELPIDFKALALEDQTVMLHIKAVNSPYQTTTTQCSVRGQRNSTRHKHRNETEVIEVKHQTKERPQFLFEKKKVGPESSQHLGSENHLEDIELLEHDSMKRLDGAINEVNFMLQRLGTMLEKTRLEFANRRSSLTSRDFRSSERFIKL